jgi:hypothetical protein
MKLMLNRTTGTHFSARLLRKSALVLTGAALGFALWTATAPMASAQGNSPQQMLQAGLPQGRTMENASRQQLLSAVSTATRNNPAQSPQIVRVAITARPQWAADIMRAAFQAVGTRSENCPLLARILRAATNAAPDQANALTELAMSLAPDCADQFQRGGGGGDDEGNFGAPPANVNPPPGSIGGGGGQGNVVAICHNNRTIFVSPRGAEAHLSQHPGDRLGPCQVTPTQNP